MSHTSTRQGGGGHAHCEGAHCQFVRFCCSTCHIARLAELIIFSKTLASNFSLALSLSLFPSPLSLPLFAYLICKTSVTEKTDKVEINFYFMDFCLHFLNTHTHREINTHTLISIYLFSYTYIGNELAATQTEQSKGEKSRGNMPRQQPQPLPPPLFVLLTRREAWPKERKKNRVYFGASLISPLKRPLTSQTKTKKENPRAKRIADETKRDKLGKKMENSPSVNLKTHGEDSWQKIASHLNFNSKSNSNSNAEFKSNSNFINATKCKRAAKSFTDSMKPN